MAEIAKKKVRIDQHRQAKRDRKAAQRNKAADYCAYLLVRAVVLLLRILGIRVCYLIAKLAGNIIYFASSKRRFIAITHLEKSFPDWDKKKCRTIARQSMQNIACMGVELLLAPHMLDIGTLTKYVEFSNFQQTLRAMVKQETPIVLVTGHFGNWELAGYASSLIGLPTNTVARRLDNPYINDYIFSIRQQAGQKMIYKDGAAQKINEAMQAHQPVSIVGDQDAGRKGLFVDFFGRTASTYKSIGLVAMQFDAPIATVFCRRIGWKFKFEIFIDDFIAPEDWKEADDPLKYITQRFTKSIQHAAQKSPEQYFWVHRRWKNRPKGQPRSLHGTF